MPQYPDRALERDDAERGEVPQASSVDSYHRGRLAKPR